MWGITISIAVTGDGHGAQTLKRALENSCNVALMQIGASMGAEEFTRYQELFGFGEMTGIDLPGEHPQKVFSMKRKIWMLPVWRQMRLDRTLM